MSESASAITCAKGIPQADVFDLIRAERAYQDVMWVGADQSKLGEWLLVIDNKLREAIGLWNKRDADADVLSKVTYLAAVAVAYLEHVGGPMLAEWVKGMEFQRANAGYIVPNQRAKRWYPVLEEILARRNAEAVKAAEAKRVADTLAEVSEQIREV